MAKAAILGRDSAFWNRLCGFLRIPLTMTADSRKDEKNPKNFTKISNYTISIKKSILILRVAARFLTLFVRFLQVSFKFSLRLL